MFLNHIALFKFIKWALDYFNKLDDESKNKYVEKLTLNNFKLSDPMDEDVYEQVYISKRLPNISVFDIHEHFVDKHEMYIKLAFKDFFFFSSML